MRNKPIDVSPWEVEAARRREVIEADFGAPHHWPLSEVADNVQTTVLVGPLASLIAGISRTLQVGSTEPAECLPHGQPGIGAPKPGT